MRRRRFLSRTVSTALGLAASARAAAAPPKTPFRLLFSSDTTHILTCASPWHPRGRKLDPAMFDAAVDEAADAGAEAYLLQPGLGWVPWWPSQVLSLAAHRDWFRRHFDRPQAGWSPFLQFVADGGDFVRQTLRRCRQRGLSAALSFRLNDAHHKLQADDPQAARLEAVPRFYAEHPELRLGRQPGQAGYAAMLHDWAHPEVREFKFRLIEELCGYGELDGLELDFMRHPYLFRPGATTGEQRRRIITDFVARVRRALDAAGGRPRWLGLRLPAHAAAHEALGLDLPALAAAGVQAFTLSTYYHLEQQTSLPALRAQAPGAALYAELLPFTAYNGRPEARSHRRSTPEQLTTAAHLAYGAGADGVALYNWQYYREQAHEPDPPAAEPPWSLLRVLRDPAAVAARPQHYLQAVGFDEPRLPDRPLPLRLQAGAGARLTWHLAPPTGGWRRQARLRLQAAGPLGEARWQVRWNGADVPATADVGEPFPNPLTQMLGRPETLRAWRFDAARLRPGANTLELRLLAGEPAEIVALDLAVPDC